PAKGPGSPAAPRKVPRPGGMGGPTAAARGAGRSRPAENTPMPEGANPAEGQDGYQELAELAGGFIHEIKNHLGTLGLNLQLLAEDFQDPESQRERRALQRVQRLQAECERLIGVSNDFLRFARIKDLNVEAADLSKVRE